MAIVIFKNTFGGNASDAIGINPAHVISVFEQDVDSVQVPDSKSKKKDAKKPLRVTTIYTVQGLSFSVFNSFDEVIARLNEAK